MSLQIRPYLPTDRQAVRDICCDTGFMGSPIDPIFRDRDAFADFFTRYYTDLEPENALVVLDGETVVGYLLGALDYKRCDRRQWWLLLSRTVPKVALRILTFRYNKPSLKFLAWFLFRAARETPKSIPDAAHFHVNLLEKYRTGVAGRRLIFHFVNRLARLGHKGVYGQIQVYESRRAEKIFNRYGFKFVDKRQTTKFEDYLNKPVWVATVYNKFEERGDPMPVME